MTAPRFARGTKSRVIIYVGLILIVAIVLWIIKETRSRIDEVRKSSEKCQQQQESLAAQLQVIFEYKLRLEKSVQQEKSDHRHTRDELQSQLEEERTRRSKEVLEANNKLASSQQHYKLLQGQHEDLAEECSKVRSSGTKAVEARTRAEAQLLQLRAARDKETQSLKAQLEQQRSENNRLMKQAQEAVNQGHQAASVANTLRTQNVHLHAEMTQIKKELLNCPGYSSRASSVANIQHQQSPLVPPSPISSSPGHQHDAVIQQHVLQQPDSPEKNPSSSTAAQNLKMGKVIQGNSQVVPVPGPPQQQDSVGAKPGLAREQVPQIRVLGEEWQMAPQLPPGVVPPRGYQEISNLGQVDSAVNQGGQLPDLPIPLRKLIRQEERDEPGEESHQLVQPLPPAHPIPRNSFFRGVQRREAEGEEEEDKAVGAAPPEQGEHKLAHNVGQEEEEGGEIPRPMRPGGFRQYHPQDNYKEEEGEEEEGVAGRWPANNQPDHRPLEAHEDLQLEDVDEDDDDDVDHIDYGNDLVNNGPAKQKQARKLPVVAKHESVMVNPK